MTEYSVNRQDMLDALKGALEPKDFALAMWEGGAAGFDRVDEWSDLDVQVIVKDGFVEQAFEAIESELAELSETDYRYRLAEPTWHGHSQCFYRFKDASPYLMLDLVFMQESSEADRFAQFRTHGTPVIIFDKGGYVVEEPLDIPAMLEAMKAAVERNKMYFDLYWILTTKEIHRGNSIEAILFYNNYVLRPLLEVLRITHCPVRHFYFSRYPHYDLPKQDADKLAELYFVRDLDDLRAKFEQAREWFYQLVETIDWSAVEAKLSEA